MYLNRIQGKYLPDAKMGLTAPALTTTMVAMRIG